VWGGKKVPYLTSVISKGEEGCPAFKSEVTLNQSEILEKMKIYKKDAVKDKSIGSNAGAPLFQVIKRSDSGRVLTMLIGGYIYKGTQIRTALDLHSTNFTFIPLQNSNIKISVIGFGHGVGMSQYGAEAMAESGADYAKILKHYYKGVEIIKDY